MASWPPSLLPIAHGEPVSSGPGVERVVGALAVDLADRVDRGQVDDVEAHGGDGVEPLGGGAERAGGDRAGLRVVGGALGAGKNSYQVPKSARLRSAYSGKGPSMVTSSRSGCRVRTSRSSGLCSTASRASTGRSSSAAACGAALRTARSRSSMPVAGDDPVEQQPRLGEHQLDVDAGRDLDPGVVAPGRDRVGPRLDLVVPGALGVGGHPGLVEVGGRRACHPHRGAAAAVGIGRAPPRRPACRAPPGTPWREPAGARRRSPSRGADRDRQRGRRP